MCLQGKTLYVWRIEKSGLSRNFSTYLRPAGYKGGQERLHRAMHQRKRTLYAKYNLPFK